MFGNFRTATLDEYVTWLKGYLNNGGVPTHYHDYPFSQFGSFLYVTGTFGLEGECGSAARHIIVEKGAKLDPRKAGLGHNVLLYMAGYKSQDNGGSPALQVFVFNDDEFLTIKGIDPHIERLVAKNSADREALQERTGHEGPLSSANDHWTGDPAMDRAVLVGRALQARP